MRGRQAVKVLGDILRHHAAERGGKTALKFGGREHSYADLDRSTNRVANALRAAGLGKGARIALLAANTDRFFELQFGAAKAGVVLVPVNFRLAPPEVAFVVNDAGAETFFVDAAHAALVRRIAGDLPTVKRIVAVDFADDEWTDYLAWRDRGGDHECGVEVLETDTACQMYTSGTTGHPKGVELMHCNLMSLMPAATRRWANWNADDVNLICMPLFHIAGGGWGIVGLYSGCTNILQADVDPGLILETIETERVSIVLFVPAVILFLTQHPKVKDTDFSSLRLVIYGASPIPLDLLQRAVGLFGCDFAQVYGLTETSGAITYLPPEEHRPEGGPRMKSCGKAHEAVEIRIVDDEGRELPAGEVGEIICRTPQNMKGYWKRPEATAAVLREGWFRTGDAGYLDADGYLYIHDRIKDMIVSGGENIYPAEVESALFGHPAIADIAVIGVPDVKWGEAVKAVVVLKEGARLTEDELVAYARERIAGYKAPKSVDFVAELPRNPSGKILKRELRAPYWEGRDRQVN
ncbi:acyl-CoA synthetase [Minwuia thermotolerans]|uniref:3-methylmercaptopropionyl-CoA ligase n=1 Tax=Minwuia thermotolerans TaxID=2056226 RepID=A0A2M9G723_9PROT|nr:acyl-CoA synthetase [Minwuia thermotolerans]